MIDEPIVSILKVREDSVPLKLEQADRGGARYKEFGRSSQISLIVGSGLADIKMLVDYFLPKPSIDRASIRMNELLKQRYSTPKAELPKTHDGGDIQ